MCTMPYIKGGTPAQIIFGEGVCNDEGYICYFFTEVSFIDWCCYYTQVSYTGSWEPLVVSMRSKLKQ
jgi:hypothetical protein